MFVLIFTATELHDRPAGEVPRADGAIVHKTRWSPNCLRILFLLRPTTGGPAFDITEFPLSGNP